MTSIKAAARRAAWERIEDMDVKRSGQAGTALQTRPSPLRHFAAKRPKTALVLAYTAVFALIMGVWVAIFAASGKSFMEYGDTIKQHYTGLMYYGRWLREAVQCLLTGAAIPTWDMSIGYGADILSTLSYYVIGDPLDLTAMLVPSQYTELLLEFLIVLRLYLAGLTFMAFSLHHGNSRFGTLLGAVAYTFCSWAIQGAAPEPIFLVPMYCFPLVLLGADYIFEGKRPVLYIAAIALSALSNFLFFYMIALLLILYMVVRYFRAYGVKQLRTLWPLLGKFIGYSLIGIAIAGVTLLPTLLEMFSSARFSLDRQTVWYPFIYYWKVLSNLTTSDIYEGYCTYAGITAVAVLGVMVLFARRKQNTVLKAAWLVMLAFMLLPWAGKALNGFTYMQNRWVWAFAMLEAFILARVCPQLTELKGRERLTLFGLLAGYCFLSFWQREARTEWTLLGSTLLLLLAVYIVAAEAKTDRRITRGVLLAGCCVGIVANLGYSFGVDEGDTLVEYREPGAAWEASVTQNPANVLKQVDDDTLWRYDSAMNDYINSAMLMDLHGTGYFFSLHNSRLSQFFAELGQNVPTEYNYKGLEGRSVLDTLLSVKYFLCGVDSTQQIPQIFDREPALAMDVGGSMCGVYQNTSALPVGFTVDKQVDRTAYEAMTPAERQDVLLNAAVLESTDASTLPVVTAETAVTRPAMEKALTGVEQIDDTTYYSPQDGGTITFTTTAPRQNCETYLVVEGMEYKATNPYEALSDEELAAMSDYDRVQLKKQYENFWCKEEVYLRLISDIGEGRIDYFMPNDQYYCGRHNFVYNFGYSADGLTTLTIVLPYAGYYTFDNLDIECQPLDTVAARADALREESLQNAVLGTNSLQGDITLSKDKLLILQLPYSEGWSATVDGQPAEILVADTAFLGIQLTAGAHAIALTYKTPGLAAGAIISLAGVLALVAVAICTRRKKPAKKA